MRVRGALVWVLTLVCALAAAPAPGAAAQVAPPAISDPLQNRETKAQPRFDPDSVLVRFHPQVQAAEARDLVAARGARLGGPVGATGFREIAVADGHPERVLQELSADPGVESVELNHIRTIAAEPNDPRYPDQPYLETLRLPQAWDETREAGEVDIAVLDTGVTLDHEDLADRVVEGYDFVDDDEIADDASFHGTQVAGLAAAEADNALGIAGAGWSARIMPVRVLGNDGTGTDADIAAGITWATDNGAEVINLSLGGPNESQVLRDAVDYALQGDVVVIAAAGNTGSPDVSYPAAYPAVIAVGATDADGRLTAFSSYGEQIDVVAPGWQLLTTSVGPGGPYTEVTGTSFSAPLVSGVAALLRGQDPDLSATEIAQRLTATARDAGPRGFDPYYGFGLVDAAAVVGAPAGDDLPTDARSPEEPNDVPARATLVTGSGIGGRIAPEGDVDWYRVETTDERWLSTVVWPNTEGDVIDPVAPGFDAVIEIYDEELRLLGHVDSTGPYEVEHLGVPVNAPGIQYIAVRNRNASVSHAKYNLEVGRSASTHSRLAGFETYPTGSDPESVAIADVTGDGRNDVLVTTDSINPLSDDQLLIFPQRADGSLGPAMPYDGIVGGLGEGLAVGDLDGDGDADVVISASTGVQVLHQGDGGLESGQILPGIQSAQQLEVADVDADGLNDIVADAGTGGLLLLRQMPVGNYHPSVISEEQPGEVEVADVSGDGLLDVVTIEPRAVRVYSQQGGGFRADDYAPSDLDTPSGIGVADLNGDGRTDVVATMGAGFGSLHVFHQTAAGRLDAPVVHLSLPSPGRVEAADVTADGLADVVTAHGGSRLSVFPQTTAGRLGESMAPYPLPGGTSHNSKGLVVGDVDGNGTADVALIDHMYGLVVLRQYANGQTPGLQAWIRSTTPAWGATHQPVDAPLAIDFVRDIDPSSITADTVQLLDGRTNTPVASHRSFVAHTGRLLLMPEEPLDTDTPYAVRLAGVTDTEGQRLSYRLVFETDGNPSESPLAICPQAVPSPPYRDIAASSVHRQPIGCMSWWGITYGTTATTYSPAAPVSRGQAAAFLTRLLDRAGASLAEATTDRFSDDDGSVHEADIDRLAETGIVTGHRDGSYRPHDAVSRAQMATFLVRAYEYGAGAELNEGSDAFGDDGGSVHHDAINKAAGAGLLAGRANGTFAPSHRVRRDQMASFLARLLDGLWDER